MPEMTSKERFMTALRGGRPDRVPIYDFLFSPKVYEAVIGRRPQDYNPPDLIACSRGLGLDGAFIFIGSPRGFEKRYLAEGIFADEWGTIYKEDTEISWPSGAPIDYPLKTREDWRNYVFPDPHAPGRLDEVKETIRLNQGELAILGGVLGPFTAAYQLTGLERFCLNLYLDPELLREILEAVTAFFIEAGRLLLEAGVDALLIADDHGGSDGPFISLPHWQEFIAPCFAEMVRTFRAWGAPVVMHNDGDIRLYLDDLVGMGLNAYHPVERNAHMDLKEIKARYGPRLCLIGNVNNKTTLVTGREEEVEEEVLECLRIAAPGGGYILASDHSLHDDMPLGNVFKMFETARRYGAYPLRLPEGKAP